MRKNKPDKKAVHTCISFWTFILAILLICLYWVMPQYLYGYNASIIDKVNRLRSIEEPKLILVGNSNLPFGIRSDYLEEEIGMPVINLGIHGGLGDPFHENMIKGAINEGDIVVVCHTDYSQKGGEYWIQLLRG